MFGSALCTADARWGLLASGHERQRGGPGHRGLEPAIRGPAPPVLLAQWVDSLYAAMARDKLPAISIDLPLGGAREVGQGQSVRVREELAWVTHVEGFSRLMGTPGLELGTDLVPVSRRAWFAVGAPSRLVIVDTPAIESVPELWRGLDRLHDLVSRFVEVSTRDADAATRERMRQRGAFQQALLRETCERLASTMDGAARAARARSRPARSRRTRWRTRCWRGCRMVGRALGLAIKPDPADRRRGLAA
jgi:hypothetical protein